MCLQDLAEHATAALVLAWLIRASEAAGLEVPLEGALALLHRLTSTAATVLPPCPGSSGITVPNGHTHDPLSMLQPPPGCL